MIETYKISIFEVYLGLTTFLNKVFENEEKNSVNKQTEPTVI